MRILSTQHGLGSRWPAIPVTLGLLVGMVVASGGSAQDTGATARTTPNLPAPIYWKQYIFSIPYRVHRDAQAPDAPVEVRLFVSDDHGTTWNEVSRVPATIKGFTYYAADDGEYWFALQTIDRYGTRWPQGPHRAGLRVIVDTQSPEIQMSAAMTPAGEVEVQWEIADDHPLASSLQIEAKTDSNPTWHPVTGSASSGAAGLFGRNTETASVSSRALPDAIPAGKIRWTPPELARTAVLRATITDRAGNQTETSTTVSLANRPERVAMAPRNPGPAEEYPGLFSPPGRLDNANQPHRGPMVEARNPSPNPTAASSSEHGTNPSTPFSGNNRLPLPTPQHNPPTTESWPVDATVSVPSDNIYSQHMSDKTTAPDPNPSEPAEPTWQTIPPTGRPVETMGSDLPLAGTIGKRPSSDFEEPVHLPPVQPKRSGLRMVNARSFALEYEVESVGPWGVGRVELWGTTDGGMTWHRYGEDPDLRSPMTATVEGEGEYGFRILVQSAGSVHAAPPRPGDTPDVWIQVDLKPPTTKIEAIRKGQGNLADHLTIRWSATDEHLAARPIALYYGSHPAGPWTTIATQLDNTGQYMWRLPQHVPDQLYIRVEACDQAGNAGSYSTADPVQVERPQPTGRIRDVRTSD